MAPEPQCLSHIVSGFVFTPVFPKLTLEWSLYQLVTETLVSLPTLEKVMSLTVLINEDY